MSISQIKVTGLTMAYGSFVVQRDLNFTINKGDIFILMGGSGCGKSTLLRHLIGLSKPVEGKVMYDNVNFWDASEQERAELMRQFGVMYQYGAMWSSMTLSENITLPCLLYTSPSPRDQRGSRMPSSA